MDKGLRSIWRWRKKRLAVVAAIVSCILMELLLAAYAENIGNNLVIWPMLAVCAIGLVLATIVLPRVIGKEMVREREQQASK